MSQRGAERGKGGKTGRNEVRGRGRKEERDTLLDMYSVLYNTVVLS